MACIGALACWPLVGQSGTKRAAIQKHQRECGDSIIDQIVSACRQYEAFSGNYPLAVHINPARWSGLMREMEQRGDYSYSPAFAPHVACCGARIIKDCRVPEWQLHLHADNIVVSFHIDNGII